MAKSDRFSHFIAFLVLVAITPIEALYNAWVCTSLWELLLQAQYGAGPSYESWYGISLLVFIAKGLRTSDDDDEDESWMVPFVQMFARWIVLLFVLGLAYFVHAVLWAK